ncbi:WAT1-related protein At5g40240-like [Pistacia vera]|uniref:WAT1-related protein At5g40240-like n=1 Tax=Pistacia vera TaxID=55513 RepID=UPI001263AFB3|nr:WAT1-related protein At5g40240-like [Pistacia vera]
MDRGDLWKEILLFAAMVSLESANVGVNVIYKAATLKGMSYYVFIFYSYAIGTLVLLPVALFFRRTSRLLPLIKFPLISRICFLGLIGCLARIFSYKEIAYSSPTLASAMSNLTPAFTFILAVIFSINIRWWFFIKAQQYCPHLKHNHCHFNGLLPPHSQIGSSAPFCLPLNTYSFHSFTLSRRMCLRCTYQI